MMKDLLDMYIDLLGREAVSCRIPKRKGLRKISADFIFHDHAEIFLQIKGKTYFSFPHENMELSPGEILIVPPELPHGEISRPVNGQFETVVITPASNFLQCHISRESRLKIPTIFYYETVRGEGHLRIKQLTDLIIESGVAAGNGNSPVIRGLSLALIASVRESLSPDSGIHPENSKIREVKNTILSRYHHNSLTVGQLADQLNCTADYLSWLFHRETGTTLNRFINQLRLKRAADLLKNTDYTISEIAWICGYRSPSYFSRIFSHEFSHSPREFRNI